MKWTKIDLNLEQCLLETLENQELKSTINVFGKSGVYGCIKPFGDFNIIADVKEKLYGKEIFKEEIMGFIGDYEEALAKAYEIKKKIEKKFYK
jgi:hypothetical protein